MNTFQRSFVGEVRRIDEMARRLRFFSSQIATYNNSHSLHPIPTPPMEEMGLFEIMGPRFPQKLDELDATLKEHEERLAQMNESFGTLREREKELIEAREVLRSTKGFFETVCL